MRPDGSSFQTRDVGLAVSTADPWFRPVDIKLGPDGALYIADWYDRQVNHYRNHEGQIDPATGGSTGSGHAGPALRRHEATRSLATDHDPIWSSAWPIQTSGRGRRPAADRRPQGPGDRAGARVDC